MTSSTKEKLSDTAKDAAGQVATAAKSQATEAKSAFADRVEEQSADLRKASEAFDGMPMASDAVKYLSDNLAQAATAVRDLDLSNVHHDLTQFARRNPLVFFGGAAALGFLAARALKASERSSVYVATSDDDHEYPSLPEVRSADADQAGRWGYS